MDARVGAEVEHTRAAGPRGRSLRQRLRIWAVRVAAAAAVVYLGALVGTCAMLRFIGESWWITTIGLYLPRLVLGFPLPIVSVALLALRMWRWVGTQAVAALVLLFPIMGFGLPWPHGSDANAPRLRVLSYNVNSGFGGPEAIVEEIDRYSPDVVLLQEIGRGEPIEALLRARYPTVETSTQFIVASRYPALSAMDPPRLPYYGQLRSPRYIQRVFETPLGPVTFYNVHPVSPREDFAALRGRGLRREILTGRFFSGNAAPLIGNNAGLRQLQAKAISESAAAEAGPVVIAGDTNLPGLSKVLARYLSGYKDGFREAGWGLGYTYPNDRKPWMRIDRIFANEKLRFVGFEVGSSLASDHLCVVADLQGK
jgi:endonuclease/exonuclease/phosphatase (EEP) superfamily protein YafD